jgi:hypothetical protein
MRVNLDKSKKLATLVADREETATIWFALEEYANNLRKTIDESTGSSKFEDRAFCYGILAQIAKLQFDIRENRPEPQFSQFIEWLDV